MRRTIPRLSALFFAIAAMHAIADQAQSLTASVDGVQFAADDDTILFVPLPSGAFSLGAATAGAAAYPPPKTPVDRLSIVCDGFAAGKPLRLGSSDFARSNCDASFTRGADGDVYTLDDADGATVFEITSARDKVIEGRFELHLKNKTGTSMTIKAGQFVAEDRQL